MKKRIFSSLFLLATVTLLLSLTVSLLLFNRHMAVTNQKEVQSTWNYIAVGIEQNGLEYLNNQHPQEHRITWLDVSGTVLYDSLKDASPTVNHKDREEIQEAVSYGTGESVRYSTTTQTETYNYAKILTDGTILRISRDQLTVSAILQDLLSPLLMVVVVFTLLGVWLSYRLARSVVKPINAIDLKQPEQANVYKELQPLVRKIQTQNQTIRSQMLDLFQQQQKFDTITDNMSEGMLIIDREGNLVSYNDAASGILSITLDQKGKNAAVISPNADFLSVAREALDGNHPQRHIAIFERTYQVLGNPIRVKDEPMGAVLALLDVTEREERDRLRQEFSANVSHELKTPLTSISGYAELMMNGMAKPKDMAQFATRIYDEAQRLILLIGDIIQLSNLEERDLSSQIETVDLYDIAKDIYTRLEHEALSKQIELRLQGRSAIVEGIPHILDEMIYNLCDNALKYNKPGGSVTLTVLPRERDIMVAVADTGIGIPFDEQERVFERFYRIDKSHSKEIGGTGLGLSIVKHGATFHNATIHLESTPGEGTCISLMFPKQQ